MKENLLLLKDLLELNSISKNVYIYKLDETVNKYNNTYHRAVKMKPAGVKASIYIESSKEINYQDPKFKTGDIVRISKYKNIFLLNGKATIVLLTVGLINKT